MRIALFLIVASIIALAISHAAERRTKSYACDYDAFVELAQNMREHREQHLVDIKRFIELAKEPNTVVLDARSKEHFEAVHIAGAVNLPYTSFSGEALGKLIPDESTRVLIYCRNNLKKSSTYEDVSLDIPYPKRSNAGLNIPTVITLYAYGYSNVWELDSVIDIDNPEVRLVVTQVQPNQNRLVRQTPNHAVQQSEGRGRQ